MQPLLTFERMVTALEALAEPTRLRIAALLDASELTVSELTVILGQSQPRVSRHLRLLVDAGVIERHREGAWAFFRLSDTGGSSAGLRTLAREALAGIASGGSVLDIDRNRLVEVRAERARAAEVYFARHAGEWDRLRSMHVSEDAVEAAILAALGDRPINSALDIGTGTGRMLGLLAPRAERVVGVDASHAMLAVARANLDATGVRNAQLRQGDIYALPVERGVYDVVIIHQVLHFLAEPARALREAAHALQPGGRLLVVDFAPHEDETLRERHAHRRLGFSREEVDGMLAEAGLEPMLHRDLPGESAGQLTVSLWLSRNPRTLDDTLGREHRPASAFPTLAIREVA